MKKEIDNYEKLGTMKQSVLMSFFKTCGIMPHVDGSVRNICALRQNGDKKDA